MPKHRRTAAGQLERDLYLASRTVGDVQAAKQGRLVRRVARRQYHRGVIRLLRRARLW
jgi:hypothetical protein